jgi:hypothetical protein
MPNSKIWTFTKIVVKFLYGKEVKWTQILKICIVSHKGVDYAKNCIKIGWNKTKLKFWNSSIFGPFLTKTILLQEFSGRVYCSFWEIFNEFLRKTLAEELFLSRRAQKWRNFKILTLFCFIQLQGCLSYWLTFILWQGRLCY